MSKNDIFTRKLSAFLHDPIDKPFILMQGEAHEDRASRFADNIGISIEKNASSDHIASAMERSFLPKGASRSKNLQVRLLDEPCIKHPLSGKEYERQEELKNHSVDNFKSIADTVFAEIADEIPIDDKGKFIYLWRNILQMLQDNSPESIKNLWQIAPADTRIPDHSIFEHLRITSACFNSGYIGRELHNNCSLFLFSIGPVQSFIAQSRKTQDLYWASFMLSYLNWKATEHIAEVYGPDSIIFPDLYGQPFVDHWLETEKKITPVKSRANDVKYPTIPNRFMAIIPENGKEELAVFGNRIEGIVKDEFINIADTVINKLNLDKPGGFDRQIIDFLQVYWSAVPWPGYEKGREDWENAIEKCSPYFSSSGLDQFIELLRFAKEKGEYGPNVGSVYSILVSLAEKSLSAGKNTREFKQLVEKGRKCSLCGQRNIKFYRRTETEKSKNLYLKLFNEDVKIIEHDNSDIKKYLPAGEGLCAVCFVKRCAGKYFDAVFKDKYRLMNKFPSTAEIAQRALTNELKQKREDDYNAFKDIFSRNFDHELLYKENLSKKYFEENALPIDSLDEAIGLHNSLFQKKGNAKLKAKQSKYYAVIMLDGDDMGKWLAGEYLPAFEDIYHPKVWKNLDNDFKDALIGKKRAVTPAVHSAISASLRDYSLIFVKKIIQKYSGALVYAGGDDLLALVSLEELPLCMLSLRAAFSGHIDRDMNVDFSIKASGFVDMGSSIAMTMGPKASASMGVCIAHYKDPLGEVISKARAMEKRAKEMPKKNAFAISLLKHSGEIVETVHAWTNSNKTGAMGPLKILIDELKKGKDNPDTGFSTSFVYTMRDEFKRLIRGDDKTVDDEIIRAEIKRLLFRSCNIRDKDEKKEAVNYLAGILYEVYIDSGWLNNFFSFLETAVFLSRETA